MTREVVICPLPFGFPHYTLFLLYDPRQRRSFWFSPTISLLSDPRHCRCVHSLLIFCRATPDLPSSFWFCRTPPPPRQ
ncbi:unnamed protein product [Meloidogyne enterolobii]|uniref:Uncharacterized protein n=1 Tax=Meloidogyne enterolobii TaxID=390850 RepID=A0ACB1A954_MELEN